MHLDRLNFKVEMLALAWVLVNSLEIEFQFKLVRGLIGQVPQ